jgi:hypothetical protein
MQLDWAQSCFFNENHLNELGKQRLTALVAAAVTDLAAQRADPSRLPGAEAGASVPCG